MKRALAALALCIGLAGCGALGGGTLAESGPGVLGAKSPSPTAAQGLLRIGEAKAEVAAALGMANVIAFDSGWEVWVYRWPGAQRDTASATELVLLFDASGLLRKLRLRQPSAGERARR